MTFPRGVLVGLEPEDWPVIVDEVVLGVELADQVDRPGFGLIQRPVEDPVLGVGPLLDREDQELAVVRDVGVGPPVLVFWILPDQAVLGLIGPHLMKVDLLVIVGPFEVLAGLGLGEPSVEEALAVGNPLGAGELDPLQMVGVILPGRDVAHLPLVPVGAGRGETVGQQPSVVAHGSPGQGHGAIDREGVGVEENVPGSSWESVV